MTSHLSVVDGQLKTSFGVYRCAVGTGGIVPAEEKQEGDGATPAGPFPLRCLYYRPDRLDPPRTSLPVRALTPDDGWCDEPAHASYNELVKLPHGGSLERFWRDDDRYDVVVPIGYNDDPAIAQKGSAIFLHVARPDYTPTRGCVALSLPDLLDVISDVGPESSIDIRA